MNEVLELTLADLTERLAARALSAREVMTAVLDRIDAVNGQVNAVVSLRDRADLMAEATEVDAGPWRGPLHGVPIAVKDLVEVKGIRSTHGSPMFADHVPEADEVLAARLRAAGAILIGKTNVPEFGLGSHSYNPIFGVTRNPYDLSHTAGGSSGGAGAALACRMAWVADGSDAMGSLRNPAGWNNVYGHRPTVGLVPGDGQGELFLHPLATLGPMARNPRDLAALLEVLAGPEPGQPGGASFVAGKLNDDIAGKRIGWVGDWGGAWPFEPGILDLCRKALTTFEDLGCTVEAIAPPFPAAKLWDSWTTLRSWAAAGAHAAAYADPEKRAMYKPAMLWEIERGRALTNEQILAASAIRSDWFRAASEMFATYDAVAMPTAQLWPFPAEWDWPKEIAGTPTDTYHRWMECVIPASLIGLPCTAMPAGFGPGGLPMGVQLAGPRGADGALLNLAAAYHDATRWPETRPPNL